MSLHWVSGKQSFGNMNGFLELTQVPQFQGIVSASCCQHLLAVWKSDARGLGQIFVRFAQALGRVNLQKTNWSWFLPFHAYTPLTNAFRWSHMRIEPSLQAQATRFPSRLYVQLIGLVFSPFCALHLMTYICDFFFHMFHILRVLQIWIIFVGLTRALEQTCLRQRWGIPLWSWGARLPKSVGPCGLWCWPCP